MKLNSESATVRSGAGWLRESWLPRDRLWITALGCRELRAQFYYEAECRSVSIIRLTISILAIFLFLLVGRSYRLMESSSSSSSNTKKVLEKWHASPVYDGERWEEHFRHLRHSARMYLTEGTGADKLALVNAAGNERRIHQDAQRVKWDFEKRHKFKPFTREAKTGTLSEVPRERKLSRGSSSLDLPFQVVCFDRTDKR